MKKRAGTALGRPALIAPVARLTRGGQFFAAANQFLGHQKGQFQGLAGIQTRVAGGVVTLRQVFIADSMQTAGAFGHILARHLEMHTTGDGAFGIMNGKRTLAPRAEWIRTAGFYTRSRI